MSTPRLRKARRIQGKTLVFSDAGVADAAFIHALRTDARGTRFLRPTSALLADQVAWMESYAQCSDEAYFVITDARGKRLGTVRLKEARGDSFSWGSWILAPDAPAQVAIESALMVYAYALDVLGFKRSHFHVLRDNARVCAFHERFGALPVFRSGVDMRYCLSNAAIRAGMARYARYLPHSISVEG